MTLERSNNDNKIEHVGEKEIFKELAAILEKRIPSPNWNEQEKLSDKGRLFKIAGQWPYIDTETRDLILKAIPDVAMYVLFLKVNQK